MTQDEIRINYRNPLKKHSLNWKKISQRRDLSEDFIFDFCHELNWAYVSYFATLSERFIEKFSWRVDWIGISCKQKLSLNFIKKFQDKIYLKYMPLCFFKINDKSSWRTFL